MEASARAGSLRSRVHQWRAGRLGAESALVAFTLLAAGAMLLYLQRDTTFYRDEWSFVLYRQGQSVENYLAPNAGNLVLLPALLYVAMFKAFGLDSPEVVRIVSVATTLLCAWLLYRWARRRVSPWGAVLPLVSILSFGPGWNDLLWPFQVGYFISLAAGIGSLILLEHDRPRADAGAAALVALGVMGSSVGLAFAASGFAMVLARGRRQPGTLALFALPVVAWLVWYQAYATADARFHPSNLAQAPALAFESAGAAMGGVTALGPAAGTVLLLGLLVLVVRRVVRDGHLTPELAGPIAFGIAFWALISLAPLAGSAPDESRYLLPGAVAILLVGVELLRGATASRGWAATILIAFALVTVSNLASLRNAAVSVRGTSNEAKAELAAVEVAGTRLAPGYEANVSEFEIEGAAYLAAVQHWDSSPAPDPKTLHRLSASQRSAFDRALLAAEGITAAPIARPRAVARCERIPAEGTEVSPSGRGWVVISGPRPVQLGIRRLGDTPTTLTELPPRGARTVRLPKDGLSRPWVLSASRPRSRPGCLFSPG